MHGHRLSDRKDPYLPEGPSLHDPHAGKNPDSDLRSPLPPPSSLHHMEVPLLPLPCQERV